MSIFDNKPAPGDYTIPIAGKVSQPDPLIVTLDRRGDAPVGPCRWEPRRLAVQDTGGHVHIADAGNPPKGTPCLVVFAEGDEAQPWVVAFTGWPTGGA